MSDIEVDDIVHCMLPCDLAPVVPITQMCVNKGIEI